MPRRMMNITGFFSGMLYWSIIALPFSVGISPGFANAVIGMMIFSCLITRISSKRSISLPASLLIPFTLLFVFSLASFGNSVDYRASVQGMFKLIKHALLFLACMYGIKDKQHLKKIIISAACGVSLVSIDALWQMTFGWDFIHKNTLQQAIGLVRPTAAFPNPNVMGVYLTAITPLVIGVVLFYRQQRHKAFLFLASLLALVGIYVTLSRGAALGLYMALLIISLCRRNRAVTTILLAALVVYPLVMPKPIKEWAKKIHYNPLVFMCNEDRIFIYRNTLNMIRHHPFIGVGINTFTQNIDAYRLKTIGGPYIAPKIYSHNNFLQMAGETGLLGLGAFVWFLFVFFRRGLRRYQTATDDYVKVLVICSIACLAGFLINGLTETSLYYARVSMIFWYIIGFSLALEKNYG